MPTTRGDGGCGNCGVVVTTPSPRGAAVVWRWRYVQVTAASACRTCQHGDDECSSGGGDDDDDGVKTDGGGDRPDEIERDWRGRRGRDGDPPRIQDGAVLGTRCSCCCVSRCCISCC
uniref:Uncharacterized protein n=2 Tax=Oryza sativa subsp. japonica TaxID=39947 RepID=Q53LB5_ORYSJ|nr:hypothetical protein LOC_Os11g14860 [Oryza sativa Japonica Group]ABA92408.1 hypothetical protein LOC_Os11g14860 [Oryza sativa Japonica Group]